MLVFVPLSFPPASSRLANARRQRLALVRIQLHHPPERDKLYVMRTGHVPLQVLWLAATNRPVPVNTTLQSRANVIHLRRPVVRPTVPVLTKQHQGGASFVLKTVHARRRRLVLLHVPIRQQVRAHSSWKRTEDVADFLRRPPALRFLDVLIEQVVSGDIRALKPVNARHWFRQVVAPPTPGARILRRQPDKSHVMRMGYVLW
jgi:hypothetical protein